MSNQPTDIYFRASSPPLLEGHRSIIVPRSPVIARLIERFGNDLSLSVAIKWRANPAPGSAFIIPLTDYSRAAVGGILDMLYGGTVIDVPSACWLDMVAIAAELALDLDVIALAPRVRDLDCTAAVALAVRLRHCCTADSIAEQRTATETAAKRLINVALDVYKIEPSLFAGIGTADVLWIAQTVTDPATRQRVVLCGIQSRTSEKCAEALLLKFDVRHAIAADVAAVIDSKLSDACRHVLRAIYHSMNSQ